MFVTNGFIFAYSIFLAAVSIIYTNKRLGFRAHEIFFSFFPTLFLYLGAISTALSFNSQLTATHFLVAQWVLLSLVLYDFRKQNFPFRMPAFNTALKATKINVPGTGNIIAYSCVMLTILTLITSLLIRIHTPIYEFDDKMYRASTPLFWIQNQSVFRFESINERKNVFSMGTGLIYMWPHLFNAGEQTANFFYWLAYPLTTLAIYLLTGILTKNRNVRALTLLLFTSAPIIVRYFTITIVQESWLGLILLCSLYFLLVDTRLPRIYKHISLVSGLAYGALLFIKPTAFIYLLTAPILLTLHNDKLARLKWVGIGFFSFLILSGYFLLLHQNNTLYTNPFGTPEFQRIHLANSSIDQASTHLMRLSFALMEFPVFFPQITKACETGLALLADWLGATRQLYEEAQQDWLGLYRYQLSTPNIRFSIGGLLWFAIFFINIFYVLKYLHTIASHKKDYLIFSIILAAAIIQALQVRWSENGGTPFRHLLSTFAAVTVFFPLYLSKIYTYLGKPISYICICILLLSTSQQIVLNINKLFDLWNKPQIEYQQHWTQMLTSPYTEFMMNGNASGSFLLIEETNTLDYPLFGSNMLHRNAVYLIHNKENLDAIGFQQQIDQVVRDKNIDYVILYNQPQQLVGQLLSDGKYILIHTIQPSSNLSITVFQTKFYPN